MVEAIGTPTGWYICQDIVKAGGHIAMLGVHGQPATINLERMWYKNFRFSAGEELMGWANETEIWVIWLGFSRLD